MPESAPPVKWRAGGLPAAGPACQDAPQGAGRARRGRAAPTGTARIRRDGRAPIRALGPPVRWG